MWSYKVDEEWRSVLISPKSEWETRRKENRKKKKPRSEKKNENKIAKLHVKFVLTKRHQTYLYTCFHTNFTVLEQHGMACGLQFFCFFFAPLFPVHGKHFRFLLFLFGSVYVSNIVSTKMLCQISARIMGFHFVFFYSYFDCKFPKSPL